MFIMYMETKQPTPDQARKQIVDLLREGYKIYNEDYERWVFTKRGRDSETFRYVYKPPVEKNELDENAPLKLRKKPQSARNISSIVSQSSLVEKSVDNNNNSLINLFNASDIDTKDLVMENLEEANISGKLGTGGKTKKSNRRRRSKCSRKNKKSKRVCKGGRRTTRKSRRVSVGWGAKR